jgi:hypothetical protein
MSWRRFEALLSGLSTSSVWVLANRHDPIPIEDPAAIRAAFANW